MNDLINICQVSCGPDFLESILDIVVLIHFALHLLLQEGGVESLDQEFLLHLDFILILVFIGGHFCDIGLSLDPIHLVFQGFFFVSDRLLEATDSFLSLLLVLSEVIHNLIKLLLSLDSLLLGSSLLL